MKFDEIDILDFGNRIQLVGAVMSGLGRNYVLVFPDESLVSSFDILDHERTPLFTVLDVSPENWEKLLYQSDVLNIETAGPPKAIARKSARQIDQNVAWAVFKRDGYRCRYCWREVPLSVDHVILWEDGGPSIPENLISACKRCNRTRGNTPYQAWIVSHEYDVIRTNPVDGPLPLVVHQKNLEVMNDLKRLEAMKVQKQRSR